MLGRPSMRAVNARSLKSLDQDPASHYEGENLAILLDAGDNRRHMIRKIRYLMERIRKQMAKNAKINGSWYKLFKNYDKNNSGDITFDELCYVVYKELEVSKLEMTPKELRMVWGILDRNGDRSVTVEEFASFMRRVESDKIDHVIVEMVDRQLVEGRVFFNDRGGGTPASERRASSPSRGSFGDAASVATAPRSPPMSAPGSPGSTLGHGSMRHSASEGSIAAWLRSYRTIGGYSSLGRNRGFQMGRPPEDNESVKSIVPRLEYNFSARQLQRLKFGERLTTGGERYALMTRARAADRLFESDDGQPVFRSLDEVVTASSQRVGAPILPLEHDSHWSQRLANIPTHSTLSRQHSKVADIKMKFKMG